MVFSYYLLKVIDITRLYRTVRSGRDKRFKGYARLSVIFSLFLRLIYRRYRIKIILMAKVVKTIFFLLTLMLFFNLAHLEATKMETSRPFAVFANATNK
jgi:hypothetical protein